MVNINIEIPDDLHRKLKIEAINSDRTLKEHVIVKLKNELTKKT